MDFLSFRFFTNFPGSILSRCFAVVSALVTSNAIAAWQIGMQEPANAIAAEQRWLNSFAMWIIVAISIVVFGVMFYSIFKHRKSVGHKAEHFHENTTVEIIWTALPMFIIIGMAFPATKTIIDYKDTSAPDMTIKVTGYQWKWSYDYLDENVFFYSQLSTSPEEIGGKYYKSNNIANPQSENYLLEVDNEMVVPVGKKIRLLLTAGDVIHAWWVPQLGVKQDAIPGIVRDAWFRADHPGVFRGQCAELCGKNHAFMPIVVRAVSEEDYLVWVKEQGGGINNASAEPVRASDVSSVTAATEEVPRAEWTMETAMQQGKAAYDINCAACHQVDGTGLPPAFPGLKKSPIVIGDVAEHINIVLRGKAGTAMASFSYLSDADIAAIVTYERNAWDNNTGDLVAPDDVKAAR
ncbi:cytochrome c oxidase subunit II [Candidatus Persebacteraceae bacterium Df01]|jgi:cytochrome c oxidase subunit 2|uniref:Cytochrome c oxidase subunit 2 n=1 Tax=Candidatus Doriopsillibacter californiensis TaxID=2970740 RepID=A0ABT7QKU0_9GAMM|nr:cytochrome c oxidase subunit II [Candidatus Persebacteraceae bacterium Df01]